MSPVPFPFCKVIIADFFLAENGKMDVPTEMLRYHTWYIRAVMMELADMAETMHRHACSGLITLTTGKILFPRATSQVAALVRIFGDCREGQYPHIADVLRSAALED